MVYVCIEEGKRGEREGGRERRKEERKRRKEMGRVGEDEERKNTTEIMHQSETTCDITVLCTGWVFDWATSAPIS